jgi:elongation factor Ts
MTNVEKVKKVREITFSPVNKVNDALKRSNGDVDGAIGILVAEKQADANEMANRAANTKIVYSYVHNNRIGAMVVLACQTDFVAKNEAFLNLAKDICMHIVSAPVAPEYVSESNTPSETKNLIYETCWNIPGFDKKPEQVRDKIVEGKLKSFYERVCLLNQKFIKDETKTVQQVIYEFASTVGEKIEVKSFTKMVAQ